MRLLAFILLVSASLFGASSPWTPANFRGLALGRAHREDAIRTLGAPDAAAHTSSGEDLTYKTRGDHRGDLTIRLNPSGLVVEVEESFPVAIPRTRIYKEFGSDAQTEHFSWAQCACDAIYRDPQGPLELTVYPSRGIAFWPDRSGYDFAAIHYLAHSPGLAHKPNCISSR